MPINFRTVFYVQAASSAYKDLVGRKILAIEGMPIDSVLFSIKPVVPVENDQFFKAYFNHYLLVPEILHAQGVMDELSTTLTLSVSDGERVEDYAVETVQNLQIPTSYGFVLDAEGWESARENGPLPNYLKELEKIYYYEYLYDEKIVYIRQSQIQDDPSEDIPTFYERVFDFIENNDVNKVVLDVRLNGGGNNYKNKPIVTGLIKSKINETGKLFVIIGRRTFSACQNLVNEISNYTNAIFVGEPTGENINFYGDNRKETLPNSKMDLYLSFAWWQDKPQWENAEWTAPHLAVEQSFDDFQSNQDPVLQQIIDFDAENFITNPMEHITNLFMAGEIEKLKSETIRMVNDPIYSFFDFEKRNSTQTGYNLLNSKQVNEALFVFQMNAQLFPTSANVWDSLGEATWIAGNKEEAKQHYEKAISLDPDGATGRNAKAMLEKMENH